MCRMSPSKLGFLAVVWPWIWQKLTKGSQCKILFVNHPLPFLFICPQCAKHLTFCEFLGSVFILYFTWLVCLSWLNYDCVFDNYEPCSKLRHFALLASDHLRCFVPAAVAKRSWPRGRFGMDCSSYPWKHQVHSDLLPLLYSSHAEGGSSSCRIRHVSKVLYAGPHPRQILVKAQHERYRKLTDAID